MKVYFLPTEKRLPRWYPLMVEYFDQLGVILKPIDMDKIKQLPRGTHVIVSESTLSAREAFNQHMKDYLEFALRNSLLVVHHLSSFGIQKGFIRLRNRRHYYFYRMPLSIATFCLHLLQDFLKTDESSQCWPGGRRAKLPLA